METRIYQTFARNKAPTSFSYLFLLRILRNCFLFLFCDTIGNTVLLATLYIHTIQISRFPAYVLDTCTLYPNLFPTNIAFLWWSVVTKMILSLRLSISEKIAHFSHRTLVVKQTCLFGQEDGPLPLLFMPKCSSNHRKHFLGRWRSFYYCSSKSFPISVQSLAIHQLPVMIVQYPSWIKHFILPYISLC